MVGQEIHAIEPAPVMEQFSVKEETISAVLFVLTFASIFVIGAMLLN